MAALPEGVGCDFVIQLDYVININNLTLKTDSCF